VPSTGVIGRDAELAELDARVRENRLVTVVGPGGVGKTALAGAAADALADRFPMGVRRVDLTRVDDPGAVAGTLAAQLGFDSFDALLCAPGEHPLLLVVDNCEHVLDTVADVVASLLGACTQPSVIATSRAPLELPGESVVALAPLTVPTDAEPESGPAVELFLCRSRDAGSSAAGEDPLAVARLCRQLDGLPLALEIAAARTRTMTVTEISDRLTERIDVLQRPRFRGDPRHRSLADTIAWSYELLSPAAAERLDALSVFVGPWSADAGHAVTPAAGFEDDLEELVTASLVVADTTGPVARYRLLETVRRFARDRLDRRGDTTLAYDRFVDHVLARSRDQLAGAAVAWRSDLLRELLDGFDDVAEALRWSIAHDDDPRRAHRLCSALWAVVHQRHADDIVELMRGLVERFPEQTSRGGAQAVAVLATAEYVSGDPGGALARVEPLAERRTDADLATVMAHRILGQARSAVGDRAGAVDAFLAGARVASALGHAAMADELEVAAAVVTADIGDVDGPLATVAEVVARATAQGSVLSASWARTVHAWLLARTDPAVALAEADAALAGAREISYPIAVAANLRTRAYTLLLLGDAAGAVAALTDLRAELVDHGALSNARLLVDGVAAAAHLADHPAAGRLAATARSLPITTLVSSQFELVPLPGEGESAWPRHDVLAAVSAALDDLTIGPDRPAGVDAPPSPWGRIRRGGDVCEFGFRGRSVTVRSSKGVLDLIVLVAAAGSEVAAVDLADVAVEQASTGEVIDARARRDYEARIIDLQAAVDEAEHYNDFARSYRLQVEMDALVEHLAAAIGRGGRGRRDADHSERARSAVTHRIRGAIRQLTKLHPALGHHLTHAVNTGTYCSYRPEQPVAWSIEGDAD